MANMFADVAKSATTLSPVMDGRTKVKVDEVIAKFPAGVTIIDFDFITTTDKKGCATTYPVLAIKEDATICFFGGTIIDKICRSWVEKFDGDINATVEGLKDNGGVKVKFEKSTTRNGNTITNVYIID